MTTRRDPDTVPQPREVPGLRPAVRSRWWSALFADALALILGLGALALIWLFVRPLAFTILGIAIASALGPVVEWLEQWIPRVIAVVLVYLLLILILVGIGWMLFPPLIDQLQQVSTRVPDWIDRAQAWLSERQWADEFQPLDTIAAQIGSISSTLVTLPVAISSSIFDILLLFFISLYWLILTPDMNAFVCSLFPKTRRDRVMKILNEMGEGMGGYVRGTAINAMLIGTLSYVGLLIIGVDYAIVLAIFAGVSEIIPFAGPIIAGIAMIGIALLDSWTKALITAIFVLILQQIESNIITPNIMHSQTHVSPLLTILAIFAGSSVGGLLGALVAIPIAAVARVFVIEVIAPAMRRQTGAMPVQEEKEEENQEGEDKAVPRK